MPEILWIIEGYAFNGCYMLEKINLPEKLIEIGEYAFCDCRTLNDFDVPGSVTSIGKGAFNGTGWQYIMISDNGKNSFMIVNGILLNAYIEELTAVIPEGVTEIKGRAFITNNESTFKAVLPKSLVKIDDAAFERSWVEEIEIPEGVTYIGDNAFYMCNRLITLTMKGRPEYIGEDAFAGCERLIFTP